MKKKHSNKVRKRKGYDHDQVQRMVDEGTVPIVTSVDALDLPGGGQFYCVSCSRYFVSQDVQTIHEKSKAHKKTLRQLRIAPYSQAEADLAGGLGVAK